VTLDRRVLNSNALDATIDGWRRVGCGVTSQKAQLCNPCPRNELSPFSREGHGILAASGHLRNARHFRGLARR
jgi:hypothetical protein